MVEAKKARSFWLRAFLFGLLLMKRLILEEYLER